MSNNKSEEFLAESTPVVDLSKHLLTEGPENFSANDPLENWDNEKTEVYVDSEDDVGNAALIDDAGERHPITAFPYILGRGNECDFVLTGKGVSRKHSEIIFQSGRFVINDLQSLNGIKVNGYKVNRVILEENDLVKLGDVNLTFTSGKEEKPSNKSRSKKKPQQVEAESSDPFGKSSGKKIVVNVFSAIAISSLLAGGYYFYQTNQTQNLEQRVVSSAEQGQTDSKQQAATSNQAGGAATAQAQVASIKSAPKYAPPPSLSMAPIASAPQKPVSATPTVSTPEVKKTPVVVKKIKPKKPSVSQDTVAAKKLLNSANNKYLSGDADSLFASMNRYENNSKVSSSIRNSLKAKHERLAKLYGEYTKGKAAHVAGNKDLAFQHWGRFMEKEKAYFSKGSRSIYADQVAVKVVEEYVSKGNEAAKQGKNHEAYRQWQKALSLGESVAAKIAIETADARAKQLYRKALRLEYVNSNKAKELWQDVVDLVPAGSEYHTKASSKLAWYDRWGA